MRRLFVVTAIVIMFVLYYSLPLLAPTRGEKLELVGTSYWLKVKMNSRREFAVQERVLVLNQRDNPLQVLYFQVFPRAFSEPHTTPVNPGDYPGGWSAGNLAINEITVDNKDVDPVLDGVLMTVPLKKPLEPGDSRVVQINFSLRLPVLNYRFGSYKGIIALGDWYPIWVDEGRKVSIYPPVGDPGNAGVADYRLELSLPPRYQVAASGELEEERQLLGRRELVFSARSMRNFAMVIGRELKLRRDKVGDTELEYLYRGDDSNAGEVMETLKSLVAFYEKTFGDYPYPKLTVAETYLRPFQGVEYPGLIMLAERLSPGSATVLRVLAHEVAHQWWYAAVGNDQMREPWLDESLATYAAKLYIEDELKQQFDFGESLSEAAKTGYIGFLRPVTAFQDRQEYLTHVYYGGTMFWTALEQQVGRERLQQFLRRIYRDYRFSEITTEEMQQEINRLVR